MDVNGGLSSQPNKSVAKASIINRKKLLRSLNWDDYLKRCDGKPAPAEYFNQNIVPPLNEFMINQKLEVTSPDNRDFIHLATVVGFMGPRLQLRLDGCDNSNDFFELVDSEVINPIGNHLVKNRYFAAPLRFRKDAAAYNSFCKQILKNAAHAPLTCFKDKPIRPPKNRFQPGMKLEAVDIKHPSNICPATIITVDKNNVEIHLDGWDSTNDYKCPYFSRNLFPVGWCKKTGHILQFPGPKAEYQENMNDGSISVNNQQCPSNNQNTITNHDSPSTIEQSRIGTTNTTATPTKAIINDKDKSDVKTPVLPPPPQNIHQMNYNEASGSTNNPENVIKFEANNVAIKNENNTTTNHNNDTSTGDDSLIKPIIKKSDQKSDKNHSLNSSVFSANSRINNNSNNNKRNFDQIEPEKKCSSSLINGKKPSINEQYDSVLPSKNLVNTWSVEELMEFLNHKFPEFHKFEHYFRSQEIDGKAFLMLTNDLMMKFLNIKLGYSLKIIDLIDRINSEAC